MRRKKSQTRYIFITGGVCSGLGKGTTTASLGAILKGAGWKVFLIKIDPYLNVDPGTMNPYQHGEVYVLEDGTETDLDLGHYERFVDINLSRHSNVTTGQIYQKVIEQERKGKFLGGTIQIIPHITDAIKDFIRKATTKTKPDFLLVEIGGTVGDIEAEPFLEAIRQFHLEEGDDRVMFIHLTLIPYLITTKELKTKPTQSSVRQLNQRGIQPDVIIARTDHYLPKSILEKIALFANLPLNRIIPAPTVKNIYEIPLNFQKYNLLNIVYEFFDIKPKLRPNLNIWRRIAKIYKEAKRKIKIGLVGKYVEHGDAYISVKEALKAAAFYHKVKLEMIWIKAEDLEKKDPKAFDVLDKMDGILVPGGFGSRGIEGKISAAKYARENKIPYLGLCLGMQIAVIEFARYVLKTKNVHSTEFNPKTKHPVIATLPEQVEKLKKKEYGASMRLGSYPCLLREDSLSFRAYGKKKIYERHRHRYEFNNRYRRILEKAGLRIAGVYPKDNLVEIIELKDHPWFVGVQFHPEFKSRPANPHPLFRDFIKAAIRRANQKIKR